MTFEFSEIKFQNPGVLMSTIPENIWNILSEEIKKHIDNKNNFPGLKRYKLAVGGIKESIKFTCPKEFERYTISFISEYYDYFGLGKLKDISLTNSWLNLQKKHEYRPLHIHESHVSYVVWYKIPYTTEEEDSAENTDKTNFQVNAQMPNGRFLFHCNGFTGTPISHILNLDKTFEGKMILFHSKIPHEVFPFFTSDEYRISLAGNAVVKF